MAVKTIKGLITNQSWVNRLEASGKAVAFEVTEIGVVSTIVKSVTAWPEAVRITAVISQEQYVHSKVIDCYSLR